MNRTTRKIEQYLCKKQIDKILKTPPIRYRPSETVTVFSMIGKTAVAPYLLAIKSFLYWYEHISVHLLNDGSLDKNDVDILSTHIPGIKISHIKDIDTGTLPTGGCWERLIKLIELSQESYVIQLDSDIVVSGPLSEIYDCIQEKRSFAIGNPKWPNPISIHYLSNVAQRWNSSHIQTIAERIMPSIPLFANQSFRITRGCAGFSGFPQKSISYSMLETFSNQMEQAIGKNKWYEWGSEQVASNYLVSTCEGATILAWPKYQNYANPQTNEPIDLACLIHFMGTNRYDNGAYRYMTKKVIKNLFALEKIK